VTSIITSKKAATGGSVAFVGAGPGDDGLLTLRAVERLGEADVVVVDQIPRDALIARHCRPGVEVVDAGFGEDGQPMTRAGRAKVVVTAARTGARVVRLMDGDPTTFTGLAEEIQACRKQSLPFEVVPGVSTASAVPVYAGVPLTPAGVSGVHILHPHGESVDWKLHASAGTTVVVLGSGDDITAAADGLLEAGRKPATPVVVTAYGTTTRQRSIACRLAEVGTVLPTAGLDKPMTAVFGEAAGLRDKASWFETKPLFGWRVLVPRTKQQAGGIVTALADHGATAQVVPTISVEPPRTPHQMEKAVKGLVTGRYEWIGFTSVNAVRAVREKFEEFGLDARAFAGLKVAAVGGVTAAALRDWGIEPDLTPAENQSAIGLLECWPPAETREAIKSGQFDAVVFTSSSTVRNLVGIAGKPHATTVVACIGPQTAKTAEEHGLRVDVLAAEPSADALVAALAEYGAGLRLSADEAGEPMLRPSQRKGSARRSAK